MGKMSGVTRRYVAGLVELTINLRPVWICVAMPHRLPVSRIRGRSAEETWDAINWCAFTIPGLIIKESLFILIAATGCR